MAINNQVVNTNGRGSNAYSNTFHGLRRTVDGKLYYTLRDKNVGTFSNDGGTTELSSDADYVTVVEEYISGAEGPINNARVNFLSRRHHACHDY